MKKVIQIGTYNRSNGGKQPFQQDRVYDPRGIAPALSAQIAGGGMKQMLEPNKDGKTNSLTTVTKDNLVLEYEEEIVVEEKNPNQIEMDL